MYSSINRSIICTSSGSRLWSTPAPRFLSSLIILFSNSSFILVILLGIAFNFWSFRLCSGLSISFSDMFISCDMIVHCFSTIGFKSSPLRSCSIMLGIKQFLFSSLLFFIRGDDDMILFFIRGDDDMILCFFYVFPLRLGYYCPYHPSCNIWRNISLGLLFLFIWIRRAIY
eukprot:UN32424